MEAEEELLAIAALAITLAGFSGAVVSFTRQGLRAVDRYFFISLVWTAFTAAFLAYVPILCHHFLAEADVWKSSSAFMWMVGVVLLAERGLSAKRISGLISAHHLGKTTSVVVVGLPALNLLLLQPANLSGWPMESGAFLYLVGLLLWLAVAGFMFAYLVLVGAQE